MNSSLVGVLCGGLVNKVLTLLRAACELLWAVVVWAVTVGLTAGQTLGVLSRMRTEEGREGDLDGRCTRTDLPFNDNNFHFV